MIDAFKKYETFLHNEQKLLYRRYGKGDGFPLLLVHGLSGSTHWWRHNIPALSDDFSLYAVELVGFGGNRSFKPLTLPAAADTLSAFIETQLGGSAHVVAHSMGGQIAMHLTARHPESVEKLVLAAPSGMLNATLVNMALRLPMAVRYSQPTFWPTLMYDAFRAGPWNLLQGANHILRDDLTKVLNGITVPTLLLWGDRDKITPLEVGEAFWKEIPTARLEVIHGAGHVVMWDRPAEFNRHALAFLRGSVATAGG